DLVLASRAGSAERAAAWVRATESPLAVVQLAARALVAFAPFRGSVKPALAADCAAGARLLSAGISISLENARVNLTLVQAREDLERLQRESREGELGASLALAAFGLEL
ncbi:MAG: cyclodeaminase/cyclohydrolase family protein, partial [Planctomycetota bacterium]|nr:cyclodeaminase/cyclohydrolase family protein [Planctomycetota bacterium]